jgi:hypothetical protein
MTWQLPALFAGLTVVLPLVYRKPVTALYVLIGAATVVEILPLGFQDSLTDTFPFFLNLNNSANLPVSISPAELVMATALAAWLTRAGAERRVRLPHGYILRAYALFMAVVLLAEAWGMVNGGDWNHSLWELRPQVYGFVVFILAASLVRERRQVVLLASLFLAGAAFKAGVGYYRYFITLHGDLGDAQSLLAHEDTYFLVMFLVAAIAAAIWVRRPAVMAALLLASPVVAVVMLENRRRVGVLTLIAALAVVVVLAVRFEPAVRKRVIIFTVIGITAFAIFVGAAWNTNNGLAGQVVRPLRTTLTNQVDQRDYLSNLYRINENADIIATYNTSPVIGVGFGLPMQVVFPLADISQQYPLWNYIPHNSLLWVGMRMGMLGMATFWALIGTIILEGIRVLRSQEDSLLRAVAAFALAAVVGELIVGYGDVQLENYRNMIFLGIMVGLVDALPRLRTVTVAQPEPVSRWAPVPALRATSHRHL